MKFQRELVIVGTGGLAKELGQLARQIDPNCERWGLISYVAESKEELGNSYIYGEARYLDADLMARQNECDVVIGIGSGNAKIRIVEKLKNNPSLCFPNLVHPLVTIDAGCVSFGIGNVITKGVIMTCDIKVGDFNLFNLNVTVGHDVVVGSYNVVNPSTNISGFVNLGDACLLGTGSQIIERLNICSGVTIGAGSVVTKNIDIVGVYVGVPAVLRRS